MATTYTQPSKESTSYSQPAKKGFVTGGTPIGLLLTLTYASSSVLGYTQTSKVTTTYTQPTQA